MRVRMIGMLSCAALAAVGGIRPDVVRAQTETGRSFEVTSVRLAARPPTNPSRRYTDSRVDLTDISLRILLLRAFRLEQPSRLLAPEWTSDVNLEVHATIPKGSNREHVPEMLKTLLITRFGLRSHVEPRPTNVYELVAADGGPKMQQVQEVNELDLAFPADSSGNPLLGDSTRETLDGPLRLLSTSRGQIFITERSKYERIRTSRGTEEIDAARITMAGLASLLSIYVDRPVIDRTKLPGVFQLRMELPPPSFGELGIAGGLGNDTSRVNEPSSASAFKAVEKLGLKLEPRRGPLDTIVVDALNRAPTAD